MRAILPPLFCFRARPSIFPKNLRHTSENGKNNLSIIHITDLYVCPGYFMECLHNQSQLVCKLPRDALETSVHGTVHVRVSVQFFVALQFVARGT